MSFSKSNWGTFPAAVEHVTVDADVIMDLFVPIATADDIFRGDLHSGRESDDWVNFGGIALAMMESDSAAKLMHLIMRIYHSVFPKGRKMKLQDAGNLNMHMKEYFSNHMKDDPQMQGGRAIIGILLAAGLDNLALRYYHDMRARVSPGNQLRHDTLFHDLVTIMNMRTQSKDLDAKTATGLIKAWAIIVGFMGQEACHELEQYVDSADSIHPFSVIAVHVALDWYTDIGKWTKLLCKVGVLDGGDMYRDTTVATPELIKKIVYEHPLFREGIEATRSLIKKD